MKHVRWPAGVAVALALVAPAGAAAATITVNTEADAVADDGHCSLREAISSANGDSPSGAAPGECAAGGGADTVALSPGLYVVSLAGPAVENGNLSGDLDVGSELTILGSSPDTTTIDGGRLDRVVDILQAQTVTIEGVTITGGRPSDGVSGGPGVAGTIGGQGGGIRNGGGPLTIANSVVKDNAAGAGGAGGTGNTLGGQGGAGGGIFSSGPLTLTNSAVIGNTAGAGGPGGSQNFGIGTGADAVGGAGGAGGGGGGVSVAGALVMTGSTLAENAAGDGGLGGHAVAGSGSSGVDGGEAHGGDGGNGGNGGGVDASGGATIDSSTLSRNQAGRGGDGGFSLAGDGGSFPAAHGGDARGGNGGDGGDGGGLSGDGPSGVNVTFDHNAAGTGGTGGLSTGGKGGDTGAGTSGRGGSVSFGRGGDGGDGGGVRTTGTAHVTHATVSANRAGGAGPGTKGFPGAPGAGGTPGSPGTNTSGDSGVVGFGGGAFSALMTSLTLANTVFANNVPGTCGATVTDGGHNVSFPFGCPGPVADPVLASLADNGGPVETRALRPGSAALDGVPAGGAGCPAGDARGVPRPQGVACDIGAYEVAPPGAVTGTATAVGPAAATLGGDVTPNGRLTTFHFEYGTSAGYGLRTPDAPAGAAIATGPVSAAIDGLAPSTPYHYRLVATNGDGTTGGADQTFTTAPPGGGPGSDSTPPVISSASLKPKLFAVNQKGKAETGVVARAKRGTTFRYTLSEPARVVFTIQRQSAGRKVGKRCRKPTRPNRARRKCKRFKLAGRFAQQAPAGAVKKKFSGRIGRRKLNPGGYRAVLVATDAAGNHSAATRLTFRVVRR